MVLRETFVRRFLLGPSAIAVDIRVIQDPFGHRHIKSTVGYARVAIDMIRQVQSPLELLNMAATALD